MLTVALTGGIGCGKSTVCQLFLSLNVPVIDTDIISHELVEPEQPAFDEIINIFGTDVLLEDGSLNRKALAQKVFNNSANRLLLEGILHPKIRRAVELQLSKLHSAYVIIAIPLLIETNQQSTYDRVLVVDCDEQLQIERTLRRDNRTIEEINAIIKAQAPRQLRLSYANEIIKNTYDIAALKDQVEQLHRKYLKISTNMK